MEKHDFVVDRATWWRGNGARGSNLLLSSGSRCCIGFCGKQLGISDSELLNVSDVETSLNAGLGTGTFEAWNGAGFSDSFEQESGWVGNAYSINDNRNLDDPTRESKLKELFAANGHTITFTGSGNPSAPAEEREVG